MLRESLFLHAAFVLCFLIPEAPEIDTIAHLLRDMVQISDDKCHWKLFAARRGKYEMSEVSI